MRTVKRESLILNSHKMQETESLCIAYSREKNYWLDVLKGYKFQALLATPRKIRDEFVKNGYKSHYGLQARHWKLALQDAAETWNKYWQAIFVNIRSEISSRKNTTKEERRYAYLLIKNYPQFVEMMKGKIPDAQFEISNTSRKSISRYISKLVKKHRGNNPTVKKKTSAKFDSSCYSIFNNKGVQYIKLMSLEPGKRLIIPLLGMRKIEGNITIVLSEKKVHIHTSEELKNKEQLQGATESVDFGYTEVMTDTSGKCYGTEFGKLLTKTSDELNTKMQRRNRLYALKKKSSKSKRKAANIQKYNLGNVKLKEKQRKAKASLEKEINTAINTLIKEKKPSILITEDLRHSFTYNKGKSINRRFSSWIRGTIQDRVAFKALAEGFRHEQVNSAYGSQTCSSCGFVDRRNRSGDKFRCLHCEHEGMADQIAALNYLRRFDDEEIGLYMPYGQVKIILLERFYRRLEAEQSVTVPGKTPETVSDVIHNNLSRENHSRERDLTGRSLGERNKMNTF